MIYRLHGTIQPYAWGGHDYIPQLLRREPSNLPAAELWFGDHPQAPSQIEADGITLPFNPVCPDGCADDAEVPGLSQLDDDSESGAARPIDPRWSGLEKFL